MANCAAGGRDRFVKITLPEGVEEDDSPLSALQTKFEQVLIAHGLLQPGRGGSGREEEGTTGTGMGEHHHHDAAQHGRNAIAL